MSENPCIAIIGGTGLYALDELIGASEHHVNTKYGEPSGPIVVGQWGGQRVAFLSRHGKEHSIAPHRVNYRANIAALAELGIRRIIAVNAVGGIARSYGPQALGVPHQLIDYTSGRLSSFSDFTGAKVEHVDFSDPYTESLRQSLLAAARRIGVEAAEHGTYGVTQGPRLETSAEILRLGRDGCDLVGMTGMPEAVLAREAQLEYASLSVSANWAAGCGDAETITMQEVFENLEHGMRKVRAVLLAWLQ